MVNYEKVGGHDTGEVQVEEISEVDRMFFKVLDDISWRIDVAPGEYAFVGNSAQKDFKDLKELELKLNTIRKENREKYEKTINYLKEKIQNNYDVE